uniref:Uncharacterized protein n=1 Tax=Setaria italica TaxID=4555 RepID=K3ZYJ5_SETIT
MVKRLEKPESHRHDPQPRIRERAGLAPIQARGHDGSNVILVRVPGGSPPLFNSLFCCMSSGFSTERCCSSSMPPSGRVPYPETGD